MRGAADQSPRSSHWGAGAPHKVPNRRLWTESGSSQVRCPLASPGRKGRLTGRWGSGSLEQGAGLGEAWSLPAGPLGRSPARAPVGSGLVVSWLRRASRPGPPVGGLNGDRRPPLGLRALPLLSSDLALLLLVLTATSWDFIHLLPLTPLDPGPQGGQVVSPGVPGAWGGGRWLRVEWGLPAPRRATSGPRWPLF